MSSGSVLGGRYRLSALLGEGGVGEVWSATHLVTERAVAIKRLIASRHGSASSEARARFVMEAQSACAVSHPNVVQVLDFVDSEHDAPFLVMELLQGETLSQKLAREGALPLEETARLLLPVVSAVGTAHARGIVHRDLKPSNIFLSTSHAEGRVVKVLDFGIAKWVATSRERPVLRTQTGSTLGTPSYMSPEQATAERDVDHRADIWSLGVILYECLSGVRPVDGENAAQMVMRLLSSGIMPIEHLVPTLPPHLSELIGRMLARDTADRPGDLSEVFAMLQSMAGEMAPSFGAPSPLAANADSRSIAERLEPARVKGSAARALDAAGAPSTLTPPELGAALPRRERSHLRRRVGFAAVVLVGIGAAGVPIFARWPAAQTPSSVAAPVPRSVAPAIQPAEVAAPLVTVPARGEPAPAALVTRGAVAGSKEVNLLDAKRPAPLPRKRPRERQTPARSVSPIDPAATKTPAARGARLPKGSECERSSDCESRLCLALMCE